MDYDDIDFQSKNLHLAGEGSNNHPPVLQPYALPKFDFDDSLQGHLRFDSLVETEVFLGIESNEANHWIGDFSRGGTEIEFNSSAAESCAISRRNNVWSEATSSESVEMLLKSVGQEESIPARTIFEELDACKELRCLTKQMEPHLNSDYNIFSHIGDVTDLQSTSPRDEDAGIDQPRVDDASQTHESKLSVDENSSDLDRNAVSGNDTPHVTNGSLFADGKWKDANQMEFDNLVHEPPDQKYDPSVSEVQKDTMMHKDISEGNPDSHVLGVDAQHINEKSDQNTTSNFQSPHCSAVVVESVEKKVANEDSVIVVEEPSDMVLQGDLNLHILGGCSDRECPRVHSDPNKDEVVGLFKGTDIGSDQLQLNTHDSSPMTNRRYAVELSNKECGSELHTVDECSDRESLGGPSETEKNEDMSVSKDTGTGGDYPKLNTQDLSPKPYRSDDGFAVEVSNSNAEISSSLDPTMKVDSEQRSSKENALQSDFQQESNVVVRKSEASLSVINENEVSMVKSDENMGASSTLTATCSPAEMFSEVHLTSTPKSPHDAFEVSGEKSNADAHVSLSIQGESTQMCDENEVIREGDVAEGNMDLSGNDRGSTELLNESNSADVELDGSVGKGFGSSSFCEGIPGKELISVEVKHDADGNESGANVSLENLKMSSCGTMDAVTVSPGNGLTGDIIIDSVVQADFPAVEPNCNDKEQTEKILSEDASISCLASSPLVETGPGSFSEAEKGASCDTSAEMLSKTVDQSLPVTDDCNTECQNESQTAVASEVSKGSTEETKVSSVQSEASAKVVDDGEAILSGSHNGSTVKDSFEKASTTLTDDGFRICEGPVCSADANKPDYGSPNVVETTELSETKQEVCDKKGPENQSASVSDTVGNSGYGPPKSGSPDGNDASKEQRNYTPNVSLNTDIRKKDATTSLQPIPAVIAPQIVERSQLHSGSGQLDNKIPQDISHEGPLVSGGDIACGGSKGTAERKTRRASSKATGRQSAKKGSAKATTPMRQSERGDKSGSVPLNQSGILQLVQPNETQLYGHVDGSIKPYSVLGTSTSSLPDLNTSMPSSIIFQQPFTDLQQMQLRAQIFVYGALIQGIVPEEAYMVSAFGGPDGGRGMWENAWHVCIERLHGQKSTPINPETPLQSCSGSRVLDPVVKKGTIQSKGISSPVGRARKKSTPTASPMIPISSPLWSMHTPVCEGLQYSVIARGSVMDYQHVLNPVQPFQTPPIRNVASHNSTWMPQASYRGPWLASPESSAAEASGHFSVFPSTEVVKLTPKKESSLPQLPTIKHAPSGSVQTGAPTNVFAGGSSLLDQKKVSASPGQRSADPKSRKRKKTSGAGEPGHITLQAQSQPESPLTLAVASSLSTSVPIITTPSNLVPKALPEKFNMAVTPSSDHLKKADLDLDQRATLSEETFSKVKEARQQAEEASALAAQAVRHSQEIWDQLDKQKSSTLISDGEAKLASAAVAIAAAAAVAKAAAAAANVASNAALQAKLMAEEALVSFNYGNPSHSTRITNPASILRGEDGTNSSSSILVAAREAAKRRVEAASAASKRAENMDSILKAAELAAEAVSQAGTLVAMGDPLPLSELAKAGPQGYWKVPQASSKLVRKSNDMTREQSDLGSVEEDDKSARRSKGRQSDKKEAHTTAHEKLPISKEIREEFVEDHVRLAVANTGFATTSEKGSGGPTGHNVSEIGTNAAVITVENNFEKEAQVSKENSFKEGSQVEVLKDGGGFGAAWFAATVLSVRDGKACVCYTELQSVEGSGKLQEWVALEGEEDNPPKIRIARPVTALGYEGTRKRRRAAMADYTWSVGDKVDAWIKESWWEGVVTEKNKKDETILTVHFPAQGEKSVVKAWHLRPSLIWKNGEWVEWLSLRNDCLSQEGDMPQEKRLKLGSAAVEGKGKDKTSESIDVDCRKPEEPSLLNLSANEKVFSMGKNTRTENKADPVRTIRTGLQKEGSKVASGIPKPGKKRKFMEVSKHYVGIQSTKTNESNDSVKFAKYVMPQGSGSRGLRNTSKSDALEKRAAESKLKGLKSGKLQSMSVKTVPHKDNLLSEAPSAPVGGSEVDHTGKTKDSTSHVEGVSGKQPLLNTGPSFRTEGATQGSIVFSSLAPSSKKVSTSTTKPRANKGKLAPAGGRLGKIDEGKTISGNPAKPTSEVVEPRRSNRRIQPTSRLLEGLQSSLTISKIPSVSHDKGHRSQNKNASRGNNNG